MCVNKLSRVCTTYSVSTLLFAAVCVAKIVACESSDTAIKRVSSPFPCVRLLLLLRILPRSTSLLLCPCPLPFFHRSRPSQPQCSTALLSNFLVCYKSQRYWWTHVVAAGRGSGAEGGSSDTEQRAAAKKQWWVTSAKEGLAGMAVRFTAALIGRRLPYSCNRFGGRQSSRAGT